MCSTTITIDSVQVGRQKKKLQGEIPDSFKKLVKLKFLGLEENKLSGSIPDIFENMSNLAQLKLDGNELSGELPRSFGKLTKLTELTVVQNKLSGSLAAVSSLLSLELFFAYENEFGGGVPDFSKCLNLKNVMWAS